MGYYRLILTLKGGTDMKRNAKQLVSLLLAVYGLVLVLLGYGG